MTKGKGVEVFFDYVGTRDSMQAGLHSLRRGGRFVLVGHEPGHDFQAKLHWHVEDEGIRRAYIKPNSPQLNGKVERSHRAARPPPPQLTVPHAQDRLPGDGAAKFRRAVAPAGESRVAHIHPRFPVIPRLHGPAA